MVIKGPGSGTGWFGFIEYFPVMVVLIDSEIVASAPNLQSGSKPRISSISCLEDLSCIVVAGLPA